MHKQKSMISSSNNSRGNNNPTEAQEFQRKYAWAIAQLITVHGTLKRIRRDFGLIYFNNYSEEGLARNLINLQKNYEALKPKSKRTRR